MKPEKDEPLTTAQADRKQLMPHPDEQQCLYAWPTSWEFVNTEKFQ